MVKSATLTTRVLDEGGESWLEIDAAEIKVAAGPDRGLHIPLGRDSMVIGSAADCSLVLHDSSVSSRHAEISVTQKGYVIRDLRSKNGVFCGAQPIERAPLLDGTRICLGDTALVVRSLGKRERLPLGRAGRFGDLVAESMHMRAVVATLAQLAASEVTVLIEGETGTGKEVAAEALHRGSARRSGPFVVFACGGVTRSLVEAELFGHERGAFTGADRAHAGMFEQAEGGTLFLDEIAELPLDVQPLLLGALERRTSRRIGGKSERHHDLRIVAATSKNLAEEVRAKRFREDLYFRLVVGRVRLPPLRERMEDLPVLADRFAREAGLRLSHEMLQPFRAYEWPGNVRELKNTILRMAAQTHPEAPPLPSTGGALRDEQGAMRGLSVARRLASETFERRYVEELLRETQGNVSQAAQLAGVSRQFLQKLGGKHGLRPSDREEND